MSEEIKEAPDGVLEQGDFKIKKKKGRPKKLVKDEATTALEETTVTQDMVDKLRMVLAIYFL